MPRKRRKRNWSYNAGERGRNWVSAFQQPRDGRYYVEWREDGRRRAVLLKGVITPKDAKQRADEVTVSDMREQGDAIGIPKTGWGRGQLRTLISSRRSTTLSHDSVSWGGT